MTATVLPERYANGRLKPGHTPNRKGRVKGTPNKVTSDMRTMIEAALERVGENVQKRRPAFKDLEPGVAYLADQAEKNPVAFVGLLRSLLPSKVDVDVTLMTRELVTLLSLRRTQLSEMREAALDAPIDDAEEI
jgi:hypothetical protein